MTLQLQCPVCRGRLGRASDGRTFQCAAGHSFDVAADGHVNLLLARQRRSRQPGDSAEMVRSRRAFLDAGHYDPLSTALVAAVLSTLEEGTCVLDGGCGEGTFTRAIAAAVPANVDVCGIDVSKPAIVAAARRDPRTTYAVASAFDIPVMDASVDIVVSNFAPADGPSLARVIRRGGKVISAHPGPDHLFEMRALVYDQPERHVPKEPLRNDPESFTRVDSERVRFPISLSTSTEVANLLAMTPYWWQVDEAKQRRIASLPGLDTEADILVTTYRSR